MPPVYLEFIPFCFNIFHAVGFTYKKKVYTMYERYLGPKQKEG